MSTHRTTPLHAGGVGVVALVDPGTADDTVARVAAAVARGLSTGLGLVSVRTPSFARDMVDARLQQVAETVGATSTTCIEDESVVEAVLAHLGRAQADLVVLGSHGRGPVGEVLLGSVSADVVRSSSTPTLLVGPECVVPESFDQFVVAVDGSRDAAGATRVAARLARAAGLELGLREVATGEVPGGRVQETSEVHRLAQRVDPPVRDWDVLHGADPAHALVEYARPMTDGVLVVGTHGRSPGRPRPLGGVAARTVRHATVPVLVVSPEAAGDESGPADAGRGQRAVAGAP